MNLIRKLKISDIVPVDFTESEQFIIDLFNDKLSDLIIFIDESRPNEINYMKPDGSRIMQLDNKSKKLWIRFDGLWEVLKIKFSMEHSDIQILVKYMVERSFKIKVSPPFQSTAPITDMVERSFKIKVSPPTSSTNRQRRVERTIKHKVSDNK